MTSPRPGPPELPDLLPPLVNRPLWVRALCVAGALLCFGLGIIGWLIPVVTGLPFYAIGLLLLGMSSGRVAGWINRLDRRLPLRIRVGLRKWTRRQTHP